jgi:hypothetical protein
VDAWVGLVGAIAGAALAMLGQWITNRSAANAQFAALIIAQCTQLIALSEDYRNRIWEERNGLSADTVGSWDLPAYRLAQAHLQVLCADADIQGCVDDLKRTGTDLGKAWRLSRAEGDVVEAAWQAHRHALDGFIGESRRYLSRKKSVD